MQKHRSWSQENTWQTRPIVFTSFLFRIGLTPKPRLTSNSPSSCLSLPHAEVTHVRLHSKINECILERGDFVSQKVSGNIWRQFWFFFTQRFGGKVLVAFSGYRPGKILNIPQPTEWGKDSPKLSIIPIIRNSDLNKAVSYNFWKGRCHIIPHWGHADVFYQGH